MDSDLHRRPNYQHQQQNMINSAIYGNEDEDVTPLFISRGGGGDNLSYHQNLGPIRGNESQIMNSTKQEQQQMMYQNRVQSHETVNNNNNLIVSSSITSAMADTLIASDHAPNLLRQSSSPAGFFKHININNGYSMVRSKDKFQHANDCVQDSSFSTNRMINPMSFPSGSNSSSRHVSRIPENAHQTMVHNNGEFGETHLKSSSHVTIFPIGSWGDSSIGFMKELRETDQRSSFENQNEVEIHPRTGLTHQLSLPTSSTELSLRSRAKRGCATHPRSIAERVRRTRISERMRKLQDLVPNMDNQTSISDMLDLALDYIKDLQKQVETLSNHHARCRCPNKQKL